MRINLKRFERWSLLAVATATLWSMGPVWRHAGTDLALAKPLPPPAQIKQLGKFLALETYYDVASSQIPSGSGYGGPGHSVATATRWFTH